MINSSDHPEKKLDDKYVGKVEDIKEENEDSDSDDEQDNIIENKNVDNREQLKKEQDEEEEEIITTTKIEPEKQEDKKDKDGIESSFDVISKAEIDNNFDHLSNFDPDDEFLNSEQSFTVIGSVMAKDEESLSEYSDFSIVSGSRASLFVNSNIIQTERDMYIEDIAMQKIIYYISFFSEDVKRHLNKKRSKEGLLQLSHNDMQIDFFELELDNIDADLIKLILDVLEHFDMFRLCLIVCNRYGMQEHVSRYLTSICYKYSSKYNLDAEILKINDEHFRLKQRQVSVLANEAIHSMLKLIDPRMIHQIKTENLEDSSKLLKPECWRYIYYLGFWKKLIYIMDTHTSLQLCYSIGDFDNFKTVYLIHYRPELSDDDIRTILKDSTKPWIDENITGLLKHLCNKVDLELSTVTLATDNLDEICQCNINTNLYLKHKEEGNIEQAQYHIMKALKIAYERFQNYCKHRQFSDNKELETDYNRNLELFDIFYFYGRIFKNKLIREGIKGSLSDPTKRSFVTNYLFYTCDFLINIIDDPSAYNTMLSQNEVNVIIQAIFIPQKVRLPDVFKMTLETLSYMLMSRESSFFKFLDSFISEFKGDKANRELCFLHKYFNGDYSKNILHYSLINIGDGVGFVIKQKILKEYKKFQGTKAGRNHNYNNILVADLEAEYLHIPTQLCFYWIKRIFYTFISQTICKDGIKEITAYSKEEIFGNRQYNEALLSQYIRNDYAKSLSMLSTHLNVKYKLKLGTLCSFEEKSSSSSIESSNSQLKWMVDTYSDIKSNILSAEVCSQSIYDSHHALVENKHLAGITPSKYVNRKLEKGNSSIIKVTLANLGLLDDIQVCQLKCSSLEYDIMLQRAYLLLDKFMSGYEPEEEDDSHSFEHARFEYLINSIYVLAKIGRLDVISRLTQIKQYTASTQCDKQAASMLTATKTFIQAIELYQCGRWATAAHKFTEFLIGSYKIMKMHQWLRVFERAWYLAIVANCDSQNGVYLPVNAMNIVAPDIEIKDNADTQTKIFVEIHTYEKEIDVEKKVEDANSKEKPFEVFIKLMKHFKDAHEDCNMNNNLDLQKMLVSLFNMIGTLAANCEKMSSIPYEHIEYFVTLFSQSELMHNDNVEKFIEYLGDKYACNNFRHDFLSIDDEQKNDTLYFEVDEDAHNQYLILFYLKQKSEDPLVTTQTQLNEYYAEKFLKIHKQKILLEKMRQPFMNFALRCKTNKISKINNLSLHEYNWVSVNTTYSPGYAIKILRSIAGNDAYLKALYDIQNTMFNVFFNHFSIRNSLDIHFIVNKLNELNDFLQNCFKKDIKQVEEEAKLMDSDDSEDESFNPFIEIGEDNKEKQFIDCSDDNNKFKELALQFRDNLQKTADKFSTILNEWLETMPEPECLNINAKQATLYKKLKWEKMLTSKDKIKKLQNILKVLRTKKSAKK